MAKEKATAKTRRRKLTVYFNQEARKSAADQLKKASWLLAAGTGALGFAKGSAAYVAVVVIGWIVCQVLATIILSIEEKADGCDAAVRKEKEDAKRDSVARRDAGG